MKYLYSFVVLVFLLFIGSGIYTQLNKKKLGSSRIDCHNSTTVFEKIIDTKQLDIAKKEFEAKRVCFVYSSKSSKYMKSKLFDHVSILDIEKMLENQIGVQCALNKKRDLVIDVNVHENDKDDPKKKSNQCKFYTGYFVVTFIYKKSPIYKIQIDFYGDKGEDMKQTLACVFESFNTIKIPKD